MFPKGRPVLLLIRSRDEHGLDDAFAESKRTFNGHARFMKLNWASKAGTDAAREFSIEKPPAMVLADSKGQVVEKIEGKISPAAMHAKLKALVGR